MPANPWFIHPPQPAGAVRLYCFAHAGGNALGFIPWRAKLAPSIELYAVQLPGRGLRAAEPACGDYHALVAMLAAEIAGHADLPCAFFGHSMGALLAFDVARACSAAGTPGPRHLLVSGCAPPRVHLPIPGLHRLGDDALIEALDRYNGTPPQVLKLRELVVRSLPAVRADFALMEHYRYRPGAALDIPITVLFGTEDRLVQPQQLPAWGEETTAPCSVHGFDGDHFFINARRAAVLELVEAALRPATL